MDTQLMFTYEWCKSCGICISFCKKEALAWGDDRKPLLKEPDRCVGCRTCEYVCPDFVIKVKKGA